jgi:hypothetical protein
MFYILTEKLILLFILQYVIERRMGFLQKDELIQMHSFLLQLRFNLENMYDNNARLFRSYDELGVTPHQIFKSKNEHSLAVFELSKGIANLLQENDCPFSKQIFDNFKNICDRFRR